jgi:hypothetical protein
MRLRKSNSTEFAVSLNIRSANEVNEDTPNSPIAEPWAQAHAGFLRAVLLIVAYCSAVISLIATIAFRGINAVAIITGALCIIAVVAMFLLPSSRASSR